MYVSVKPTVNFFTCLCAAYSENGDDPSVQIMRLFESKIFFFSYPYISLNICLGVQKNGLIDMFYFEFLQHMFWLRNKRTSIQLHIIIWRHVI